MGNDTPTQSVQTQATNLLGGIPFGQIIGGPLAAAVDAQGQAAMETVQFISAVGFQSGSNGTEAVSVSFTYQKNAQTYTLTVPLLTIVPIPFLRIASMNISFIANIQADTSTQQTTTDQTAFNSAFSESANYWFVNENFNASVSNTSSTNTSAQSAYNVQYTINVTVNATQDSMPAGLQAMLNILANAITPNDSTNSSSSSSSAGT